MKYIKTPVGLCFEGKRFRDILDADGNLIAGSVPVNYAKEILRVLNVHDQNVDRILEQGAELAAVRRQNEALYQACEAAKELIEAQERFETDADRYIMDVLEAMERMTPLVYAALAKVKGDQCPTTE